MTDDFTPQTAFEGYVAAKLESMTERLNALPCSETFKRLSKCENELANIKGKTTVIGAVAGFVSALAVKWFLGK